MVKWLVLTKQPQTYDAGRERRPWKQASSPGSQLPRRLWRAPSEAEAEALREEVDSLRKVESMAIEGVERLEDQVDEAEARCERAEGELRAKVAEAVEARGRAARSEEALRQLQQSAAAKEKEGGDIQREQAAREATLREDAKLARREKEMMQEMVSSLSRHHSLSTKPNTQHSTPTPAPALTPEPNLSPCPSPTPFQAPHRTFTPPPPLPGGRGAGPGRECGLPSSGDAAY